MISRSLDKAKEAFSKKDVKAMIDAHEKKVHGKHGEAHEGTDFSIKSMVYGGLDGIITTFAIVAGVAGASLSSGVVLVLGFSNLLADGISMAVGDYLSTKAEQEAYDRERTREKWEVEHNLKGEKEEMVEIYVNKGYSEKDAKALVNILAKKKEPFVDAMMVDELELFPPENTPVRNAITTFVSFVCFGFIPLVAYILALFFDFFSLHHFFVACVLTGLTMFGLGVAKVKFTGKGWFMSGLEVLIVGGIAASCAYGVGALLSGLV